MVVSNKGIFDIYNLSGVKFSNTDTIKIDPSLSLDSNKSVMYCHYKNGKYDMQVIFKNQYSHGIIFLGGSIAVYDDI